METRMVSTVSPKIKKNRTKSERIMKTKEIANGYNSDEYCIIKQYEFDGIS